MAKKAKAAPATKSPAQGDWPESINLRERFPKGHERAGELRYALTKNGEGRMDMMTYRDVPQSLVDAALAAEALYAQQSAAA